MIYFGVLLEILLLLTLNNNKVNCLGNVYPKIAIKSSLNLQDSIFNNKEEKCEFINPFEKLQKTSKIHTNDPFLEADIGKLEFNDVQEIRKYIASLLTGSKRIKFDEYINGYKYRVKYDPLDSFSLLEIGGEERKANLFTKEDVSQLLQPEKPSLPNSINKIDQIKEKPETDKNSEVEQNTTQKTDNQTITVNPIELKDTLDKNMWEKFNKSRKSLINAYNSTINVDANTTKRTNEIKKIIKPYFDLNKKVESIFIAYNTVIVEVFENCLQDEIIKEVFDITKDAEILIKTFDSITKNLEEYNKMIITKLMEEERIDTKKGSNEKFNKINKIKQNIQEEIHILNNNNKQEEAVVYNKINDVIPRYPNVKSNRYNYTINDIFEMYLNEQKINFFKNLYSVNFFQSFNTYKRHAVYYADEKIETNQELYENNDFVPYIILSMLTLGPVPSNEKKRDSQKIKKGSKDIILTVYGMCNPISDKCLSINSYITPKENFFVIACPQLCKIPSLKVPLLNLNHSIIYDCYQQENIVK